MNVKLLLTMLTVISMSINSEKANAGMITISDTEFEITDWSTTVLQITGSPSHTESQVISSGNPGAFRKTDSFVPTPSTLFIFHQYTPSFYDPSILGMIDSLDYSEDNIMINSPTGAGVGTRAGLIQDDVVYRSASTTVFLNTSWQTFSLSGLTAADFTDFDTGAINPDFGTTGSPIHFGYIRRNGNAGTRNHGIDNWSFSIQSSAVIPEPSTYALILIGLIGLGIIRRKNKVTA